MQWNKVTGHICTDYLLVTRQLVVQMVDDTPQGSDRVLA